MMSYTAKLLAPADVTTSYKSEPSYNALVAPSHLKGFYVGTQGATQYADPIGIGSPITSEPIVTYTQIVGCTGFQYSQVGGATVARTDAGARPYDLTATYQSDAKYVPLLAPTDLKLKFKVVEGDTTQYTGPTGIDSLSFGMPELPYSRPIGPAGIDSQAIGNADIILSTRYISLSAKGIAPAINQFGLHDTVNRNQQILLGGINSLSISPYLYLYNLRQYIGHSGKGQSLYGDPYLQGGVKTIYVSGYEATLHGHAKAINTTADKLVSAQGIESPVVPAPIVSPRIIYTTGIYQQAFGIADIRTPVLLPDGFTNSSYGKPTIWFHTRTLSPSGINSYESGYPLVFDPAQSVYPPSLLTSAIFGDTAIKNRSFVVRTPAINDGGFSDYNTLTNSNRYYAPKGINSQAIGSLSIENGTPELFPSSFNAHTVGAPAIGYRVRLVQPSGFDRLQLGAATLTKTPELLPIGITSLSSGVPTVWHRVRTVKLDGKDQSSFGKPVTWFRYRNFTPESWSSSHFGYPSLTHGVREVISSGYTIAAYGIPWVSRGTRYLQPTAIYQEFSTNHMVGGHQNISLAGYIATLFGERIIPISQSLYPIGFAGKFGLAAASLYTRYISPQGYISIGQQPADRWGQTTLYNLTQYIGLYYQGDSGLVPPKWSEWQSIENRNKRIGVVGFNSQKFGYSQIDNNATPLLIIGIAPPIGAGSMVSHAVRYITTIGVESLIFSEWVVVNNGARVLAPVGDVHTATGQSVVINTRRYYSGVGRIDSLEVGTPTIGYRIRTIDIEPRYSIEPPQINLPTIDLYTRYVSFQGYETAKYGTPSLSIHFNIIAPKWPHREMIGLPALHNVTPELHSYGHNSDEYGNNSIRTQWRNIYTKGDTATLFGAVVISDTKQHISVRGILDSISSQLHTVTKTGTNPYTVQNIFLNDEGGTGGSGGINIKDNVGRPSLNQNVLYPSGIHRSAFGTAFVWTNNLMPIGFGIDNVPTGARVKNKKQVISLAGKSINSRIEVGKPRMSPHTIWAVMEAPDQAKANHPESYGLHYVGGYGSQPVGFVVGRPSVESTIRGVGAYGADDLRLGSPSVSNKLNIVYCEGLRLSRFGYPSIPFTPQAINIVSGISNNSYGGATVDYPPYTGPQMIEPKPINSLSIGLINIELWTRTVSAIGSNSLSMGYSRGGDNPYMWQSLRVGEFVPMAIGAGDISSYGTARISLRVREIALKGLNAFKSEYDIENFGGRIRVANSDKKLPTAINVFAHSITPISELGITDLKHGQQFIRPDGNSDQYRKGGYHA